MNKREIANIKLEILKHETSILTQKVNSVVDKIWKIRQISLTLWLAAIGIGLGAIKEGNAQNANILAISVIIPVLFLIIDSRYNRRYRIFNIREKEIQKFLSQEEYILPSTNTKILFEECLKKEKFDFPIYDINGNQTFKDQGFYKWEKSLMKSYTDGIPLMFYGIQILTSILFTSLEFTRQEYIKHWWIPLISGLFVMLFIFIYAKFTKNKVLKERKILTHKLLQPNSTLRL